MEGYFGSLMLSQRNRSDPPIKLFDSEHQAFVLVFGKPSGRIPVSSQPRGRSALAGVMGVP